MEAHHLVEALGMLEGQLLLLLMAQAVDGGKQQGGDTGVEGTLEGGIAVNVEGFVVEVAVGVDERHLFWQSWYF
jgi:hypothetical protein